MAIALRERDYPGLTASSVCGMFQATVAARGDAAAIRTRGDEVVVSWHEYGARVRALAAGLAGLGLRKGDTVGTMLTNRPEFFFADTAAMHLGAITFGCYNTSPPDEIADRLDNADARIVVSERQFLPTLREALALYGRAEYLIVVDGPADGALSLSDVEAAAAPGFDFDAAWRAIEPHDVMTMIYTSGTTGRPKGAQWSHANALAECRAWSELHPLPRRAISYLPYAHAGERMMTHYMAIAGGATVTCCPDYRTLLEDVIECHPDFFVSVPRMFVKLKVAIRSEIGNLADSALRGRLERTIELGERLFWLRQAGSPVPTELTAEHEDGLELVRSQVLSKWGLDRVDVAVIGSAPSPTDVIPFYHAVGVPLMEGYGLTESSFCAVVGHGMEDFRTGTIGRALPGVELDIAPDGEILLRGGIVFSGYRKQPDVTAETITPDGWLHTGDLGALDEDGRLKLIGRKKELIINLSGKNMSPVLIEDAIRVETPLIAQCVAIGNARSYVVALITLDSVELTLFTKNRGIELPPLASAIELPEVAAEIAAAVDRGNKKLSRAEQVKTYRVLADEWVPDSDELTPTAKLRRNQIEAKYIAEIDALYA